jgi:hypothetical protein
MKYFKGVNIMYQNDKKQVGIIIGAILGILAAAFMVWYVCSIGLSKSKGIDLIDYFPFMPYLVAIFMVVVGVIGGGYLGESADSSVKLFFTILWRMVLAVVALMVIIFVISFIIGFFVVEGIAGILGIILLLGIFAPAGGIIIFIFEV